MPHYSTTLTLQTASLPARVLQWNVQPRYTEMWEIGHNSPIRLECGPPNHSGTLALPLSDFGANSVLSSAGQWVSIQHLQNNYTAAVTSVDANPTTNEMVVGFDQGRVLMDSPPAALNCGGDPVTTPMTDGELTEWLGETKFATAVTKANERIARAGDTAPLRHPADDLAAIIAGVRRVAVFDVSFLSCLPDAVVLYQFCLRRGCVSRFTKTSDRHLAAIGEAHLVREAFYFCDDRRDYALHLATLMGVPTNDRDEFVRQHDVPAGNCVFSF